MNYSQNQQPRVIVTNVDMKFGTMIVFMIKWALAAIPAMMILGMIFSALVFFAMIFIAALGAELTR